MSPTIPPIGPQVNNNGSALPKWQFKLPGELPEYKETAPASVDEFLQELGDHLNQKYNVHSTRNLEDAALAGAPADNVQMGLYILSTPGENANALYFRPEQGSSIPRDRNQILQDVLAYALRDANLEARMNEKRPYVRVEIGHRDYNIFVNRANMNAPTAIIANPVPSALNCGYIDLKRVS